MTIPTFCQVLPDGVLLSVKLQPRASANRIGGASGSELRVKVTAPPVDSAANEALIRLMAEELGCPRNRIELVRGQSSRHKTIRIYGISAEEIITKLSATSPDISQKRH